jgi:uncharacterized protein (TIGR03435 family)
MESQVNHMMNRQTWRGGFSRGVSLAMAAGILLTAPPLLAQADTSPAAATHLGTGGKPLTFDVVSTREDKSEPTPQNPPQFGATPDGYRLKGPPLALVIRTAYIPSQGGDSVSFAPYQIMGLPAWFNSTRYDIEAKVSEADLPRWKDPAQQPAMLRSMLQAMLADRFKLTVHRETKEVPIYEMTVARNGPKFKLAESTELAAIRHKHPNAVKSVAIGGGIAAPAEIPASNCCLASPCRNSARSCRSWLAARFRTRPGLPARTTSPTSWNRPRRLHRRVGARPHRQT